MGIALNGIASGMDTASMISQLMQIEKIPYDNLQTKKTEYSTFQSTFRSINTKINTLKYAASDLALSANFKQTSVTSSNETNVKVTSQGNAVTGNYTVDVTALAKQHVMEFGDITAGDDSSSIAGQTLTIYHPSLSGGSKDITLRGNNMGEVLDNFKNDVNSLGVGLSASVINTSGGKSLVLTAMDAGSANSIEFGAAADGNHPVISLSQNIKDALKLNPSDIQFEQAAGDATVKVNGVTVTSSSNEIKDVIPGVTLQLLQQGTSTVSVKQDADKVANTVEAFVDAYNDLVKTIRNNMKKPTDSTTKTLQGDPLLRDLDGQLSDWMNSLVGDKAGFKILSDIGLEIDKGVTSAANMTGTIQFDKDLFKQKYAQDPIAVQKMFTADKNNGDGVDGLGTMFKNNLSVWTDSVDGLITSKIKGYDAEISFISDQMESMNERLNLKQEALQKQFSAMETALGQLKNQQSWMSSQLSALTVSKS